MVKKSVKIYNFDDVIRDRMMNLDKAKIDQRQLEEWIDDYWVEFASLSINGKDILVFEVNFNKSYRVMYNYKVVYHGIDLKEAVEVYNKEVDRVSL